MILNTRLVILFVVMLAAPAAWLHADEILVLSNSGHGSANSAINNLNSLGHSVTTSTSTLTDYSSYDQVWDLRYGTGILQADRDAFADFIGAGGSMYFSGENGAYDTRNQTINSLLNSIGAGAVGLAGNTSGGQAQSVTSAGQVVMDPHSFSTLNTYYARLVTAPSTGFLVSESSVGSGQGSLVGWDFGDIGSQPNSRLLVGYDIELFDNGVDWTDNVVTFLGASHSIPESGCVPLILMGLLTHAGFRRRRRLQRIWIDSPVPTPTKH